MITDKATKFITGVKDGHILIMTTKRAIELPCDARISICYHSSTGREILETCAENLHVNKEGDMAIVWITRDGETDAIYMDGDLTLLFEENDLL